MKAQDKCIQAVLHVVHEYANFISSGEMVFTGLDIAGEPFRPPINIHVWHAFLLNCRKMADFFQAGSGDDVNAEHYVPGFTTSLTNCEYWRDPVNKQLTHITYMRVFNPREITRQANRDMYDELKQGWANFRKALKGTAYEVSFDKELKNKLAESSFTGLPLV